VTHDECLTVLFQSVAGTPEAGAYQAAAEHVASCSDCWRLLELAHALQFGEPPPRADRLRELFGCAAVQDDLFTLVDLSPAEMHSRHPVAARHLAWCHACLGRLVEMREVEQAVSAPAAAWRDVLLTGGARAVELVGEIALAFNEGVARFVRIPAGVEWVSTAGLPVRGETPGGPPPAGAIRVPLDDGRLVAVLHLAPSTSKGADICIDIASVSVPRVTARLIEERSGDRLVGFHAVPVGDSIVLREVPQGRYRLEIVDPADGLHVRLPLVVERAR